MTKLPRESVLRRLHAARDAVEATGYALEDFRVEQDARRRRADLANYVIHARRVTSMLQRLRNEAGFEAWYSVHRSRLEDDPLARFFYKIRVAVEHHESIDAELRTTFKAKVPESGVIDVRIDWDTERSYVEMANVNDPEYPISIPPLGPALVTFDDRRLPKDLRWVPAADLMERHLRVLAEIVASAFDLFGVSRK